MNLHQKLIEIRKAVPYLQKIENNVDQGFKYNSSSQVLAIIRREMDAHKIMLIPNITGHTFHEKSTIGGKMHLVEMDLTYTWVDAENPTDSLVCKWYSQGTDQQEKNVGKCLTYSEKFFLLKFFQIATDKDDPNAFEKRLENGTPGTDAKTPAPGKSSNVCPKCGIQAIIKGKEEYGGGWLCFDKKGGCGEKFADDPTKQPATGKAPPKVAKEPKPLGSKQGNTLIEMGKKIDLSAENVMELIADYCERNGGRTYANGQYMIKNFQKVVDAHIDKVTGDTSKTAATKAIDEEFGEDG